MKTFKAQITIMFIGLLLSVTSFFMIGSYVKGLHSNKKEVIAEYIPKKDLIKEITTITTSTTVPTTTTTTTSVPTTKEIITTPPTTTKVFEDEIVIDGMTEQELANKLNKSLKNELENTGHYFASYTKKTGLDPYLAVAIVLHETGCKWTCSTALKNCNNVGGVKGSPNCENNYKGYETLEVGINSYLDMLYNNYYSKGLNTPELMNPKYATSPEWAAAINKYIDAIKQN